MAAFVVATLEVDAGFVVDADPNVVVATGFVVAVEVVGAGVILFIASRTAMRARALASWTTTDSSRAKFLISMVPPVGGSNTRLPFSMPTNPRVLSAPSTGDAKESPTITTKVIMSEDIKGAHIGKKKGGRRTVA